jgi:adenylate cyclase
VSNEQRKLAAIMFTDMVGYSALVQRSEKLALELLDEHRRILRDQFPHFKGTEIKTIGDAFLVEFGSALEAAECAIAIQRAMAKRNGSVPAEKQIQLRIGIHIGDVVHRAGDVFGDGVNIASRIEPMAGAGGICVSIDVERQIRNSLEAKLERLGPAELKNIALPVELFRILLPWEVTTGGPLRATPRVKRSIPVGLALAFVVTVAAGAALYWALSPQGEGRERPFSRLFRSQETPAFKSVAVLPFANMSSDKGDEYLGDAISEDIITALSKLKGLKVPARTSSFAFKNRTNEIRQIGGQLNVEHVLEGSISRVADKLRVTAQLISVRDGFHLWSETYDRELADLLAIRSDIATRVAEALRGRLLDAEVLQPSARTAPTPEAYRLYLQGRCLWNRRTGEALRKAVDCFEQAILKDPTCALAYAGLADCYIVMPEYAGLPQADACAKSRAAALRALELEPGLAEPHGTLAVIKMSIDWDWPGAEAQFRRAIELNPNYSTAHHWFALFLREQGRLDEALGEILLARELDPLSPMINGFLGTILEERGDAQAAFRVFQQQIAFDPSFAPMHEAFGTAYLGAGKYLEALSEFETARRLGGHEAYALAQFGIACAYAGKTNEAENALSRMIAFQQQGQDWRVSIAALQHLLGRDKDALDSLEKAVAEKAQGLGRLKVNRDFQTLRPAPRFQAVLRQLNLAK